MSRTLVLPSGRRLRSASQRRYVLVRDRAETDPYVIRRSDDPAKLRRLRPSFSDSHIIDQTTGLVVV